MLKGAGRGLVITQFLAIVNKPKRKRKATEKKTEKLSKPTLSMFFFVFCFSVFSVIEKCIEMLGFLPAKIVPRGGGGSGRRVWVVKPKNRKEF